jgi:hypothetical protein
MAVARNVSEVSDVVLGRTNASGTVQAAATGAAVFAGLIVSRKGRPGVALSINGDNYETILGKPYHMREGVHAEGMRQLAEAVKGGAGYVVRVTASNALSPVLTVKAKPQDAEAGAANPVVASAIPYGSEIELGNDDIVAIQLIDGDNESERTLQLVEADVSAYGAGFYELKIIEKDVAGLVKTLESMIVSFSLDAVGVDGRPAFIEDKINLSTARMKAVTNTANLGKFEKISDTKFTGGTSGTASTITQTEYMAALSVLKNSNVSFTHVLALGCYIDPVLIALEDLADSNIVQFYCDIEPNLSYEDALERRATMGLSKPCTSLYHIPYTYTDPVYGSAMSAGLSGFAFAAKAAGVEMNPVVGGWHYPNAGESRGTIPRSGLVINSNAGEPDYKAMYKARINKLGLNSSGQLTIDDSLTASPKEDHQRFEWINAVDFAIGRGFVSLGKSLKHEPEGVTVDGLTKGMSRLLSDFTTAQALVKPMDPADGTEPWTLAVVKNGADLFSCTWSICVAGSGRRITGQSRLIK